MREMQREIANRSHCLSVNPSKSELLQSGLGSAVFGIRYTRFIREFYSNRTGWQVVKMLVAVVVLFAICWGPMLVDNVLTAYGYLPRLKGGTHKHLNTAFQLMAYFNRYACVPTGTEGLNAR